MMFDFIKDKIDEVKEDMKEDRKLKKKAKAVYREQKAKEELRVAKKRAKIEADNRIKDMKKGRPKSGSFFDNVDVDAGLNAMLGNGKKGDKIV